MTIHELRRHMRRMAFHLRKSQRAKLSAELTKELSKSFKHEPHPVFEDQPH